MKIIKKRMGYREPYVPYKDCIFIKKKRQLKMLDINVKYGFIIEKELEFVRMNKIIFYNLLFYFLIRAIRNIVTTT